MEEPLTISQIVEHLLKLKEKYGDIKVGTWNDGIIKFIRSVKYTEATDYTGKTVDTCAQLQWWDEGESE